MSPIERIVVPPILRARSAMKSVIAEPSRIERYSNFLAHHPLTDVGWTMHQLDPARRARIEESHRFDVHQSYASQIECDLLPVALQLHLQLRQMLRSQPAGQTDDWTVVSGILFNLQRHLRLKRHNATPRPCAAH